MNYQINHNQVRAMLENGIGMNMTAKRLGCSARQVIRIKKQFNISPVRKIDNILNTPDEWDLWKFFFLIHRNYAKVAWKFGVTREAIRQRIELMREVT